ncbi:biogenesis of lysosome-related organelles complex 1 subunit 6-like [Sycon ciliatum]|uniref:biogenesis of lysosome-related organelles complex 1 subunit 6-like n=1 Tax=Sycon ciliatum TaxID=27933 RepID=UPI0020AC754A|eukprot:scpid85333/ scgid10945/ Pallidin; Pallid protein homolog; Syntaxin 13-interacting protein
MASDVPVAEPLEKTSGTGEEDEQAIHVASVVAVPSDTIDQLASGMMGILEPDIQKSSVRVQELLRDQELLINMIQEARESYTVRPELQDIVAVFNDAPIYRSKLQSIGREMHSICDRVRRLKQRAVKLQEAKQKQEIANADALERQRQREKHLEAKPAGMPGS